MNEISRQSINISKFDEFSLKHHNSITGLRAEKYLHILEYSYNLQCLDKKLDIVESSIPCPKNCASSDFLSDGLQKSIKNNDFIEMITNPYLWAFSSYLKDEITNISTYEWSPPNFINNHHSVLAILNSVGNIELYAPRRKKWESIFDFSSIVKQYLISETLIPPVVHKTTSLNKLKEIVYRVGTSAFCWGPELNTDRSCYFVTAQKNGFIYFWHLMFEEVNLAVKVVGHFETDEEEIMSMAWIPGGHNTFLFIYCNMLGQVIGKVCKIEDGNLCQISSTVIWKYKDRMIPTLIEYIFMENRLLLTYNKHRHFVVQMFDESLNFISQAVTNVNDERITSISKNKNKIYLGTINIKIYKANFTIKGDDVDINLIPINLKDSYSNHELYGMAFSENTALCNIVVIDRRISCRKVQQKLYIICLSVEGIEPEHVLLSNPFNNISKMWDCIELIRYKAMKTKQLPPVDYALLYKEGESDPYKMKVYLILLNIYQSMESTLKNLSHGLLPETSIELVRNKLLAASASSRLREIYKKINTNAALNEIELDCLHGCKMFLDYFSKKYNKLVVPEEVLKKIETYYAKVKPENNYSFICQWCDDVLNGFSCKNGHINMFCILTFTQINSSEYLVCRICNVTAKIELKEYQPQCPFCDSYLDYHSINL